MRMKNWCVLFTVGYLLLTMYIELKFGNLLCPELSFSSYVEQDSNQVDRILHNCEYKI